MPINWNWNIWGLIFPSSSLGREQRRPSAGGDPRFRRPGRPDHAGNYGKRPHPVHRTRIFLPRSIKEKWNSHRPGRLRRRIQQPELSFKPACDVIKIDRSLTRQIYINPKQRALLHSIVEMAKINSLTVVSEGVETKEDQQLISASGVQYIQGFTMRVQCRRKKQSDF